jgi:hypothetical protein
MGGMFGFYFNWGILLQIACVIHFIRRRPNTYWLWIILMFGPLGSLAYILVEVIPDAGLLRGTLQMFPRRRRIRELQRIIIDNPSSGNLEELADLYLEDGKPAQARELYDRAITPRTASIDPYYRRGLAALALDDLQSALGDFSLVVTKDPKYDFHRAAGLLAHVCARLGHADDAEAWFKQATALSTASELAVHYAEFLEQAKRPEEARQWAQRVLDKRITMPHYLARRERPWFRRARAVMKRLAATATSG